jgi:HK97 family phage major capsid protein
MSDVVKKVLERRATLVNQMREVAERAVEDNRDMTADEDRQFTEMNAEVDALQKRADAMLEGEKRAKETEEAFANISGKPKEREIAGGSGDKVTDDLRAWMTGAGDRAFVVPSGGRIERRDLSTSSTGIIDTGFRAQLWEYMIETAGVLQAGVDLLQTSSGETIKLPRVTVHPTTAAQTEATTITESDPTFDSVNSTVTKHGFVTQLSRELIDDSGVDLTGYLARAAGRAMGNAVGAAAVTAALAAASAGATTAAGTAPRARGSWLTRRPRWCGRSSRPTASTPGSPRSWRVSPTRS